MTKQKVFVVDGGYRLGDWMLDHCGFPSVDVVRLGNYKHIQNQIVQNDILVFEGGTDISPMMYGQRPHPLTNIWNSVRDQIEKVLFTVAIHVKARILGICRGAQLTTALAGGSLYQHILGHQNNSHVISGQLSPDQAIRKMQVNSTHHQMMNPFGLPKNKYQVLGWCDPPLSRVYFEGPDSDPHINTPPIEPEVVWYPHIKSLCIQGHPEWEEKDSQADMFYRKLVEIYLKFGS